MKPSSKKCSAATKVTSKREDKKGINIRWNSGLFFQIGLIVGLISMFFVMEIEVGTGRTVDVAKNVDLWDPIHNVTFTIEKEPEIVKPKDPVKPKQRDPVQPTKPLTQGLTIVDDGTPDKEDHIAAQDGPALPVPTTPGPTSEGDDKPETKSLLGVEFVPVFPGCESAVGNSAKIDCMSSKIRAFIGKKFDAGKFDYFEPGSVQKIYAVFTIDAEGNVVDIQARAKDSRLEAEALQVIQKLPVMKPGRQGDKAVNVTYGVPITFQVNY